MLFALVADLVFDICDREWQHARTRTHARLCAAATATLTVTATRRRRSDSSLVRAAPRVSKHCVMHYRAVVIDACVMPKNAMQS